MKHGGDLTEAIARHGGAQNIWLDLSTGINPRPWPIPARLPDHAWQRLPSQADEAALVAAARRAYGVPDGVGIATAGGTQMLIQWLPYLAAPGPVAIVGPTYTEHAIAWGRAGRDIIAIDDLGHMPDRAVHAVVVNPNNPDGRIVDLVLLARAASKLKKRGGWLVIDEAFADAAPAVSAVALCVNLPVVILRSFGKFYGLAGVRLGFAIGPPDIVTHVVEALGPWPCSGPALHIGTAALRDREWSDRTRRALAEQADRLDDILMRAGFAIVGGTPLFRLARHPQASMRHAALAREHIWCRSFEGADDLLRFGLPPDDIGFARLAAALAMSE